MLNLARRPLLSCTLGLAAATTAVAQTACGTPWVPGEGVPGVNGFVSAFVEWDPDGSGPQTPVVVVGGSFEVAGGVRTANLAIWDPATGAWSSLGTGFNAGVTALAVLPTGELVAGGGFTMVGGVFCNHAAIWNGSSWQPLGTGTYGEIDALAVMATGELVACGDFQTAGGFSASNVQSWNGSSWQPLGAVTFPARSMIVRGNGDLVVGGYFLLQRWNGTSWQPLGAGLNGGVAAFAELPNGDLVAGGDFTTSGSANLLRVARWDGTNWNALGSGLDNQVYSLAVLPNGDLLAGGFFTHAGPQSVVGVARFNGSNWQPYGAGIYGWVRALHAQANGSFLAGGLFQSVDGVGVANLALHTATGWQALARGGNAKVLAAAALPKGDFAVGGEFTTFGARPCRHVAYWDGSDWQNLGAGIDGSVQALLALPSGGLVAAGSFATAGGGAAANIAHWDGVAWHPFGPGLSSDVLALAVLPNGDLVAGGRFGTSGGVATPLIARWDGLAWHALGGGLSLNAGDVVTALAVLPNGDLIAGGTFQVPGVTAAQNLARWNGTSWQALGTLVDPISALAVLPNGNVVAATMPSPTIWEWNGVTWTAQAFPNGEVRSLCVLPDGDLIAGGAFTVCQGVAKGIVRRHGATWTNFSSGVTGFGALYPLPRVEALAFTSDGDLVVGGEFERAGGLLSCYFARITPTCPATVQPYGNGCTSSAGPVDLAATALPWLGATFRSRATGVPANGFAVSILGLGQVAIGLPTLLAQGIAGCNLSVTPDLLGVVAPVAGTARVDLAIPSDATLVGQVVRLQVAPFEFGALGALQAVTSSNGLALTIGVF